MTWRPLLLAASLFAVPACPAQVTFVPDSSGDTPTAVHYTWHNASPKPMWLRISLREGKTESEVDMPTLPPLTRGALMLTLASLRPVRYWLSVQWENTGCAVNCESEGDGKVPPQSGVLSNAVRKETAVDSKNGLILATVADPASSNGVSPFFHLTVSTVDPATLPNTRAASQGSP